MVVVKISPHNFLCFAPSPSIPFYVDDFLGMFFSARQLGIQWSSVDIQELFCQDGGPVRFSDRKSDWP